MDELEREVRTMMHEKAAGMPNELDAAPEYVERVARRRTTKLAGAGVASMLVVAIIAVSAGRVMTRSDRVQVATPTTITPPATVPHLTVPHPTVPHPTVPQPTVDSVPAPPSNDVTVATVACPLQFIHADIAPPDGVVRPVNLPARTKVGVAASAVKDLSLFAYVDTKTYDALLATLAPTGWECLAASYENGSVQFDLFPRDAGAQLAQPPLLNPPASYKGPLVSLLVDDRFR